MRVSSAVLRLVAEVPAALVQVAPMEVELFNDIFVMPLTLMVHLDGLLEGGAEVAIEGGGRTPRGAGSPSPRPGWTARAPGGAGPPSSPRVVPRTVAQKT